MKHCPAGISGKETHPGGEVCLVAAALVGTEMRIGPVSWRGKLFVFSLPRVPAVQRGAGWQARGKKKDPSVV